MRLLLAAALFMAFAPLPAAAQQWYRVSDGDEIRSYVDLDSLSEEDGLLHAETLSKALIPLPDSPVRWIRTTVRFDCAGRRSYLGRVIFYDAKRTEIFNEEDPDKGKARPVVAGTDAVNMIGFACNVDRDKAVPIADPWTDEP